MQSTSSEAQVTQAGQAIEINNMTCEQLFSLFAPMFGPCGATKALVGGGLQMKMVKDGYTVCREVPFTHPTSIIITRGASSLYKTIGDGATLFVLLTTETFSRAYKLYCDRTPLPIIINSMQLPVQEVMGYLQSQAVPLTDNLLRELAVCTLRTKGYKFEYLADIVVKAMMSLSASKTIDPDMIEVIRMEGGDVTDSIFVDGLVLDHSGRHYVMPKAMNKVCVLISNMSLEYEKPEINAEFKYNIPEEREKMSKGEHEFILEKVEKIVNLANELKKENRSLLFITEKGIDPYSLEKLGEAGVVGLRRAKRRNLERLMTMCGGRIVTQTSQICKQVLGYCEKVTVHSYGENKYTILEGTPTKGSATILVRGYEDSEEVVKAIKITLQSLFVAVRDKCCVKGGIRMYKALRDYMVKRMKEVDPYDSHGYKIIAETCETLIKVLIKNSGKDVNTSMASVMRGEDIEGEVVDNLRAIATVFSNAIATSISILMCDEIIRAGKPIKEERTEK